MSTTRRGMSWVAMSDDNNPSMPTVDFMPSGSGSP